MITNLLLIGIDGPQEVFSLRHGLCMRHPNGGAMEPLDLRVWILKSLREAQRTTMAEFLKEDVSRSATRSNSALSCKSTYRSVSQCHTAAIVSKTIGSRKMWLKASKLFKFKTTEIKQCSETDCCGEDNYVDTAQPNDSR